MRALKVYDKLRQFHKNTVFELLFYYKLTKKEKRTLIKLSNSLYSCERLFSDIYDKKLEQLNGVG